MRSECCFYLDRAAQCLDMVEYVDKQYRKDLIQIARGWVLLAQEEVPENPPETPMELPPELLLEATSEASNERHSSSGNEPTIYKAVA